jgi:toxin secretion/phage lysis holin
MKLKWEYLFSGLAGVVGLFFGSNQEVLKILGALVILMCFDVATGVWGAVCNNKLSSYKWTSGIKKKVSILLLISCCYFVDHYNLVNVGMSLEAAAAIFFAVGEFISILENFIACGVKLPKFLLNIFAQSQVQLAGLPTDTTSPDTATEDKSPVNIRNSTEGDGGGK